MAPRILGLVAIAACGGHGAAVDAAPDGDLRCATPPALLGQHPHAAVQATAKGQMLAETAGFAGRIYWGYGDMEANTGPIEISSYDPATASWTDHLLFDTEQTGRFRKIGTRLWAPATDPKSGNLLLYAVGNPDHSWTAVVAPGQALHVLDVVERVPGDVYIVGSDTFPWATGPMYAFGAAAWRSTDAQPFTEILPVPNEIWDPTSYALANAGAVRDKLYAVAAGGAWVFDGTAWARGPDLGSFGKPVRFGDVLVFEALGRLLAYDGDVSTDLGIRPLDVTRAGAQPAALYDAAEGHIVVVTASGDVVVSTDLTTWSCIGRAPDDVASVGILDGTIYFGGGAARAYALPAPSW